LAAKCSYWYLSAPRSLTKTNGDVSLSPLEPAQGPELVAGQGVGARGAVLDPPHMQHRRIELDLVPAQVARRPKPVPGSWSRPGDRVGSPWPRQAELGSSQVSSSLPQMYRARPRRRIERPLAVGIIPLLSPVQPAQQFLCGARRAGLCLALEKLDVSEAGPGPAGQQHLAQMLGHGVSGHVQRRGDLPLA
jgi:hypothetical protein